ncbi:MAG: aminotransferase class III-fold pyridoxal phosphate-dependent enzyme, partial [Myxococcota bacterium]
PTSVHLASLVRGRLHAEVLAGDDYARSIEAWVNTRLDSLAQRFAELVHNPRCRGYAFAFDMPSAEMLSIYLAQRFYRGAIVFGSGTKTVRYRLNRSFALAHVERLFEAITHTLEWMQQHQGPAPAWEDDSRIPSTERAGSVCDSVTVRVATPDEAEALLDAIMALEAKVYEAARRDARTKLQMAFEEGGVAVVAEVKTESGMRLVGSALGAPLERIKNLDGCVDDPYYGAEHTLYSLALTVDPEFRGMGLGYKLKSAQLRAAASIRREDASPRYRHATARNRVGATDAMMRISERLGGYEVFRLESQYEAQAAARYYRMPLGAFQVDPPPGKSIPKAPSPDYDLASLQPLSSVPASLTALHERGGLFGPAVNKITLCNYITPAVARAVECVESLMPALPHLYLASSRDEVFDKAVRLLRHHRAESQSVLGFSGGYFGHTTAAARALSDPDLHRQGPSYFRNFFRVPHPCDDEELSIQALMRRVDALGGAEKIVGLFFETLQERTGQTISDAFFLKLKRFRDETGIPLVAIETASSYYRSARGPFAVSSAPVIPDVVGWWSGAQSGFLHCSDDIFVTKPLTFVSTWDGDELSMIRCDHTLRHLRHVDLSAQVERFEQLLRRPAFVSSGFETRGLGLYRVFCMNEHAEGFTRHMRSRGFALRTVPGGAVPIALPLDFGDWDALESAFNESIAALNRTASKGARQ